MEQDKNHKRKCPVFKRIKYFYTSQEKREAHLLDYMQEHPELTPSPPAPPGNEFQKIITELDRRGYKTVVRKQLKLLRYGESMVSFMHKPTVMILAVIIFLGCTSVGVSANKSYNYQVKGQMIGKSGIFLNYDPHIIIKTDELQEAYAEIENKLGIHALKLVQKPSDMKLYELGLEDGSITMKFSYNHQTLYFIQANCPVPEIDNAVSDRSNYRTVQNKTIDQKFIIQKSDLEDGTTEFSSGVVIDGAYYYLAGIISEQEFVHMIENLEF